MAMEVKVYYRKKIRVKTQQIDHIPKCFQLRRSPSVSKPRTDFYLPICFFKDIELETRSSKDIQSSVTVGCSDTSNDTLKHTLDRSSTQSTEPESRKQKNVKSFGQKAQVKPCSNRWHQCLPCAFRNIHFDRSSTQSTEPESRKQKNVKSFGQKAQVKPCSNRNNEDRYDSGTTLELTPNRSHLTEKDNSSSSSRAGTVRSKRERKPKVHFDEVSCPLYTSRKVRRFKIMRSLGLAAPVGSPFISSKWSV